MSVKRFGLSIGLSLFALFSVATVFAGPASDYVALSNDWDKVQSNDPSVSAQPMKALNDREAALSKRLLSSNEELSALLSQAENINSELKKLLLNRVTFEVANGNRTDLKPALQVLKASLDAEKAERNADSVETAEISSNNVLGIPLRVGKLEVSTKKATTICEITQCDPEGFKAAAGKYRLEVQPCPLGHGRIIAIAEDGLGFPSKPVGGFVVKHPNGFGNGMKIIGICLDDGREMIIISQKNGTYVMQHYGYSRQMKAKFID